MEELKGELKETIPEKEIEKRKNSIKKRLFGWIEDNYDKIFVAILILAFIIRLVIFLKTMNQPLWWDEADYLSAAKKWAGINPYLSDIWYYRRGFLWPLIGAPLYWLGIGEIGMRFLVVLFSTGIVAVSYFLIKKMFNKKLALLVSIGLSLSWVILFFTGRVLTDIPAAFFVLLSLLFFWKGYVKKEGNKFLYLFALFFALAMLTRMQSAMLAPPFLIFIFVKEKFKMFKNKQLWITLGIFLLLLVPQFVLYAMHYGNPIADIASHYFGIGSASHPVITGESRGLSTAIFNYFVNLPYIMSTFIFVALILGIFYFFGDLFIGFDKIFKNEQLQTKFFVLTWILSLFLIMGFVGQISYIEQRYVTAALPFLFLIVSSFLLFMGDMLVKNFHLNKNFVFFLAIVAMILLLIPNITLTSQMTESKLNSYSEIQQAGLWIKANSNLSDMVMTQSRPQIIYYAERSVQSGEATIFENQTVFENTISELKPRYLVLSVYEQSPTWVYGYPESHPDKLAPVQVYSQSEQPIVIIYEFKY